MTDSVDLQDILIGTAGHIDHGKTRLVARLTGIETDRLPEEKARGISIDLGFAHWETDRFRFGVVDVPGHERFVKNMVAGATGVNLALLVIAADDGVMPQTREHLEIMDLLGIQTGLIAVTKIDLVDPDFVELVAAEIEDLTAGTFLDGCPVIPVSSETGAGIDELKETLIRVAADIAVSGTQGPFRMPIDRVFSLPGHGTVVTGSVQSGSVQAGETLELLPEQRTVRVRSVETHGEQIIEHRGPRRRTAINLAGVKTGEVARGMELSVAGYLKPTQRLLVQLRSLPGSPLVLKDRMVLNLHLGTAEVAARIVLKGRQLKPGDEAPAELRLASPVTAVYNQPFILRRISPAVTVGGGRVVVPYVPPQKRIRNFEQTVRSLRTDDETERLSAVLANTDDADLTALDAARLAGIPAGRFTDRIEELKASERLIDIGRGGVSRWIHHKRLEALADSVLRTVRAEIARQQPRRSLPPNTLTTACRQIARPDLLEALFAHLLMTKRLVRVGANVGPADVQVRLTKNQQQARNQILSAVESAGLTPPTVKELAAAVGMTVAEIGPLLNLCVEESFLMKVSEGLYFSPAALEQARRLCENLLGDGGDATMACLRDTWGVTRKFAVPLCEFFDERGTTQRHGDVRKAGPRLSEPFEEAATVGSGESG